MLLQGCGFLPMRREESLRELRLSSHVRGLSQGCGCFFNSSTSLTKAQTCVGTCGLMVDCASTHLHACVYVVLQSGLCMSKLWPLLSSCIQGILIMCAGCAPFRSSDLFLRVRDCASLCMCHDPPNGPGSMSDSLAFSELPWQPDHAFLCQWQRIFDPCFCYLILKIPSESSFMTSACGQKIFNGCLWSANFYGRPLACYIVKVAALKYAWVPKKFKMLFLYIQSSMPCSYINIYIYIYIYISKSDVHHWTVYSSIQHQLSSRAFRCSSFTCNRPPLPPKTWWSSSTNRPLMQLLKSEVLHNQTVYTISTF